MNVVPATTSLGSVRPAAKVNFPRDREGVVATVLPPEGLQREGWGWPILPAAAATPPLHRKTNLRASPRARPSQWPPASATTQGLRWCVAAPAAFTVAAIGGVTSGAATAYTNDNFPPPMREQAGAGRVAAGKNVLTRCSAHRAPTLLQ